MPVVVLLEAVQVETVQDSTGDMMFLLCEGQVERPGMLLVAYVHAWNEEDREVYWILTTSYTNIIHPISWTIPPGLLPAAAE